MPPSRQSCPMAAFSQPRSLSEEASERKARRNIAKSGVVRFFSVISRR